LESSLQGASGFTTRWCGGEVPPSHHLDQAGARGDSGCRVRSLGPERAAWAPLPGPRLWVVGLVSDPPLASIEMVVPTRSCSLMIAARPLSSWLSSSHSSGRSDRHRRDCVRAGSGSDSLPLRRDVRDQEGLGRLTRLRGLGEVQIKVSRDVIDGRLPPPMLDALAYAFISRSVRASEYQAITGRTAPSTSRDLGTAVRLGYLISEGTTRDRWHRLRPLETPAPGEPGDPREELPRS
jgi:hypothetical protein